jgi:hypothetical protein
VNAIRITLIGVRAFAQMKNCSGVTCTSVNCALRELCAMRGGCGSLPRAGIDAEADDDCAAACARVALLLNGVDKLRQRLVAMVLPAVWCRPRATLPTIAPLLHRLGC